MAATNVSLTDLNGNNPFPTAGLQSDFSAASPNAAGFVAQPWITGLTLYSSASFLCAVRGATGGTLDIYLQTSPDGGTTIFEFAHLTQLAALASLINYQFTVSKRVAPGTAPITTVGGATSPLLAAGVVNNVDWGDRIRVLFNAGAGTSAGASQTIKAFFTPGL